MSSASRKKRKSAIKKYESFWNILQSLMPKSGLALVASVLAQNNSIPTTDTIP